MQTTATWRLLFTSLKRWERIGLWLLLLAFLLQGANVANRSVFLERRFTDLGIYLHSLGGAADGRGHLLRHRQRLPLHLPASAGYLAHATCRAAARALDQPHVPFLASVIVWYAFSVFCGLWAIHLLAMRRVEPAAGRSGLAPLVGLAASSRCWSACRRSSARWCTGKSTCSCCSSCAVPWPHVCAGSHLSPDYA